MSVKADPGCPRCDGALRKPSIWESGWHCREHGEVSPLWPALSPSRAGLSGMLHRAAVPVWQQALEIFEELRHPEAEQVREKLSRATAPLRSLG